MGGNTLYQASGIKIDGTRCSIFKELGNYESMITISAYIPVRVGSAGRNRTPLTLP